MNPAVLLLLVQAAAPATVAAAPPPPPQRIDLLAKPCPDSTSSEVVVCGQAPTTRLPLPEERGPPDHPVPGNPDVSGTGALAMARTPCAATQWGCQVGTDIFGIGTAVGRLIGKAIDPDSCCDEPGQATSLPMLLRDAAAAFRKKPDKSNRVAIDLDAPPPPTAGRLSP